MRFLFSPECCDLFGSLPWMVPGLLFLVRECVACSVAIGSGFGFSGVLGRFVGLGTSDSGTVCLEAMLESARWIASGSCGHGVEKVFVTLARRGSGHASNSEHCLTAARTGRLMRCGGQHFLRRLQSCVEDESQPVQCGFATGVEESSVADPMEPGREGMLKEAPHELDSVDPSGLVGICISVFDTDAHIVSFNTENTAIGDHTATDVLPEVFDGVLSGSGSIDGGVPVHPHQSPEPSLVDESGIEQRIAEQSAQTDCQGLGGQEELGILGAFDTPLGIEPDCRNDVVHVRVIAHVLSPALEHAEEAGAIKTAALRVGE